MENGKTKVEKVSVKLRYKRIVPYITMLSLASLLLASFGFFWLLVEMPDISNTIIYISFQYFFSLSNSNLLSEETAQNKK